MASRILDLNVFEQRFHSLFYEAPFSAALLSGDDFLVEMANAVTLDLWGKDDSILGKPLLEAMPEMKDQEALRVLREVYRTGQTYEGKEQVAFLHKEGELRKVYVNFVYKAIKSADGKITGVFAVGYDVTDQVVARLKLQRSDTTARVAIESTGLGTFELNYKTHEYQSSPRFDEIFGFRESVPHSAYVDRIHPDDIAMRTAAHQAALTTGKLRYEARLVLPDKSTRWVKITGSIIFDDQQTPELLVGTALDITEEKLLFQTVQESEEKFRTLITETPEVAVGLYIGRELRIQYVNDVMLQFWGKDESILGKTWREAVPELQDQPFMKQLDAVFTTGEPFTGREVKAMLERNGKIEVGYYNYTYKGLKNSKGEIYAIHHMAVDVTDQVVNKHKIEKNEARLEFLADSMPQVVWIAEGDGTVTYYNKRVKEFAGVKQNEDGMWFWQGIVHPDDVEETSRAWTHAVRTQTPYELKHRIMMRDGSYRWHLSRAYAYQTDEGTKWYGTATDVHDQKILEVNLEKLVSERTLELKRSNDDLQQFAHVASHDLKEPVRKIKTYSLKLQDEYATVLGERGNKFVNKIISASDRMNAMISGVLNYASIPASSHSLENISLAEVVAHVETDLEILIQEKNAQIVCADLPAISGIPDLMHQLFYNIINNALKFSKPGVGSVIQISSRTEMVDEKNYHKVTVSDNGIGFEQEYAEQIFTSFVRLNSKDRYEGSGLGLALCQKIVERHHGFITATSEIGKGAQFHIFFPTSPAP
jgi:PAS domain S-box-containing protein